MTAIFDKEKQKNTVTEHSIIHKTEREKNDSWEIYHVNKEVQPIEWNKIE